MEDNLFADIERVASNLNEARTILFNIQTEDGKFEARANMNDKVDAVVKGVVGIIDDRKMKVFLAGEPMFGTFEDNELENGVTLTVHVENVSCGGSAAAGYNHTAIVTESGQVYVCGKSGSASYKTTLEPIEDATGLMMQSRVKQISANAERTVCVTEDGLLFEWHQTEPQRVEIGHTVVQASSGEHSACVTSDGELYVFGEYVWSHIGGSNSHKMGLGIRDVDRDVDRDVEAGSPLLVRGDVEGRKVTQVSVGPFHMACIDEDGHVFLSGGTDCHCVASTCSVPTMMPGLQDVVAVQVDCGATHTLVVSSNGELWSWGNGNNGRLGHGDTLSKTTPERVKHLENKHVVHCAGGGSHSLCVVDNGTAYSWGKAEEGRLGHGDTRDRHQPEPILGVLTEHRIVQVAAGVFHSVAIADTGDFFTWGALGPKLGYAAQNGSNLAPTMIIGIEPALC